MILPLTPLQKAYLLGRDSQLPLGGVAMQDVHIYRGQMSPDRVRTRLSALVARHDALRTRIDPVRLQQHVSDEPVLNFDVFDLRDKSDPEARMTALCDRLSTTAVSLDRAPWHVAAIQMPDDLVVLARFDGLTLDGASIAGLLAALFSPDDDPGADPVQDQGQSGGADADADQVQRDAAYWQQKLAAVDGPAQLPYSKPLETIHGARYARRSATIPREVLKTLRRKGAAQGLFLNAVLSSVLLEVVARWTPDLALCVAVPVAPATDGVATTNTSSFIAVQYDAKVGDFPARAATLQRDVLAGLDHTAHAGIHLNRMLLNRNGGTLALPVVLTNGLGWARPHPDSPMRPVGGLTTTPQTALDIRLALDAAGNLILSLDHATEALNSSLIDQMLASMTHAVTALANAAAFSLGAVSKPGQFAVSPVGEPFHCSRFLERIAERLKPDNRRPALLIGDREISYGDLGQSVRCALAGLRARGIQAGDVVAICLPRGHDHVTVQLACALAGIVWVPIDAAAPAERQAYLCDVAQPALVVTSGKGQTTPNTVTADALLSTPENAVPLPESADLRALSASADPGYYLFTSGTTGRPKCVVLSNRATSNTLSRTLEYWQVRDQDRMISVTPLHHDMSVFDIFGTLSAGAALVLPEAGAEKDAVRWAELVRRHGVTLWVSVPAILEMLLACAGPDDLTSLRLVAQGGDYVKPTVIDRLRTLLPEARLFSLGGPTETTIWSIWHEIGPSDREVIPYGRAIAGNRYFVLNPAGELCPPGVTGRIHTTGVGVSLGYLADGALDQTDFVTIRDDHGQTQRAYRSGDLGYVQPNGILIFAGRVAGYVKVRGVRLSLSDVENALISHPALRHVLVVDIPDPKTGETCLAALVVANPGEDPAPAQLRDCVRAKLPETHVPSRFELVEELPLNANGKPDRGRARAVLQTPSSDHGDPTARVLDIYLRTLAPQSMPELTAESPLVSLGLRPSHLPGIAQALNTSFGTQVTAANLIRCQTARQVVDLLAAA